MNSVNKDREYSLGILKEAKEKLYFQGIWNEILETPRRDHKARDYVYASEIGGSMIDRYHKMIGTPYTNPPNSRSMRKFMAGDIWEWIVKVILERAGINYRTQERVRVEYPNLLPVSGKVDFIITGKKKDFEVDDDMPEWMRELVNGLRAVVKEESKDFQESILEIKSVGSFVFEDLLTQDNPKTHHIYQAYIYRKATGLSTDIVYVCRDDVRILQYCIDDISDQLDKLVQEDLKQITQHYQNKVEPEKESLIIFENGKFKKNWKVEYSPYLSKFYEREVEVTTTTEVDGRNVETKSTEMKAFEDPMEYYEYASALASSFNRVLTRIKNGSKMTDDNLKKIEEMKKYGWSN